MRKSTVKEPVIKPFKNSTEDVWVGFQHYRNVNGQATFIAGGIEYPEVTQLVQKYFKP